MVYEDQVTTSLLAQAGGLPSYAEAIAPALVDPAGASLQLGPPESAAAAAATGSVAGPGAGGWVWGLPCAAGALSAVAAAADAAASGDRLAEKGSLTRASRLLTSLKSPFSALSMACCRIQLRSTILWGGNTATGRVRVVVKWCNGDGSRSKGAQAEMLIL